MGVQTLDFRAKVIKVVSISNLIKVITTSSPVTRVIQKQLNSGQYHVFTMSLCKQDQKIHKRAVNVVEPAVPRYLRWSE